MPPSLMPNVSVGRTLMLPLTFQLLVAVFSFRPPMARGSLSRRYCRSPEANSVSLLLSGIIGPPIERFATVCPNELDPPTSALRQLSETTSAEPVHRSPPDLEVRLMRPDMAEPYSALNPPVWTCSSSIEFWLNAVNEALALPLSGLLTVTPSMT